MKNRNLNFMILLFAGLLFTVASCNKDETIAEEDTTLSQEDAFAESLFDDVSNIADEAYELGGGAYKSTEDGFSRLSPCATITFDTTVYPRELTIDFGEVNCLCNDGRYRRGMIIITFTGRYRHPGTVITTGFDNYFVNDNQVDGTKVVTNMGPDHLGHPYYLINVTGIIHKANNGGTLSWNASKKRTWIEGFDSRRVWDDVYLIEGEADGIRPSGLTWEREIINPLRKEMDCRWIVSGTVELRPEGRPVRVLDYGGGECDNIATVLINGVTYTIFLP